MYPNSIKNVYILNAYLEQINTFNTENTKQKVKLRLAIISKVLPENQVGDVELF